MPKKKKQDDPKEQSERFEKAVQELMDAGELNPTEAEDALQKLLLSQAIPGSDGN